VNQLPDDDLQQKVAGPGQQGFELPKYSPGEVIGGKYVVTKLLGEGLLGAVYQATEMKTKDKIALKILRPNLVAEEIDLNRFTRELNLAKQLKHPGIVDYFEIGEHEGLKFFTMELIDGVSLRDKMREYEKSGRDFTPQEMYAFLIQVLEILRYAHRVTLHRNLKPENILVVTEKGRDGKPRMRIKVSDFAIAHVISPTIFASSFVRREEAYYLAPELNRFQDKAGPESDIYSVSAIFYEMLTGKPPQGRYELPSEVNSNLSKRLDTLVEIGLAPNPADRFQTAEDMINTVKLTFADLYGGTGGTVYRVLAVLAILMLAGAGVGTYFLLDEPPNAEEIAAMNAVHMKAVLEGVNADNTPMDPAEVAAKQSQRTDMAYIPAGYYLKGRWDFDEKRAPRCGSTPTATNSTRRPAPAAATRPRPPIKPASSRPASRPTACTTSAAGPGSGRSPRRTAARSPRAAMPRARNSTGPAAPPARTRSTPSPTRTCRSAAASTTNSLPHPLPL